MKKSLIGLFALSLVAYALPAYNNPQNGTTVWETGDTGLIPVTATITSQLPIVRYVVFASNDEAGSDIQDSLTLKPYTITYEAATNIFTEANPKIFVKRVNDGANGFVELQPSDKVSFKIKKEGLTTADTAISSVNWFTAGKKVQMMATAFLTKSELEEKIKDVPLPSGGKALAIYNEGAIVVQMRDSAFPVYTGPNTVTFYHSSNGVLEVISESRTLATNYPIMPKGATRSALDAKFAGDNVGNAISIEVKVDVQG